MLEDSRARDKEGEEDNDKEDVDDRPSNKLCARKPYDNDSNNKGATLSSRLNAKQRASVAIYTSLIELLKS